jgi:hypothetical protein
VAKRTDPSSVLIVRHNTDNTNSFQETIMTTKRQHPYQIDRGEEN